MKKLFAATIFLAAMSVASSSMAQASHFSKNEPYAKARVFLLKHGWKPVHAPNPGFERAKGDIRCEGRVRPSDYVAKARGIPLGFQSNGLEAVVA